MMWQPIETAPKDGTHVLVLLENGIMAVAVAYTKRGWGYYIWDAIGQEIDSYTQGNELDGNPVYWMKLPSKPENFEIIH